MPQKNAAPANGHILSEFSGGPTNPSMKLFLLNKKTHVCHLKKSPFQKRKSLATVSVWRKWGKMFPPSLKRPTKALRHLHNPNHSSPKRPLSFLRWYVIPKSSINHLPIFKLPSNWWGFFLHIWRVHEGSSKGANVWIVIAEGAVTV